MIKEVRTREDAFYCDICGERIRDAYWGYGGYASAAEETEKCCVCSRDTCPSCREHFTSFKNSLEYYSNKSCICKECLALNKERIKQIEQIKKEYASENKLLENKYLGEEHIIGKFSAAPKTSSGKE